MTLDQTAFYPNSGGQPHDTGRVGTAEVLDVIEEEDGPVHILSSPLDAEEVACEIDWARRFDHMQQHTGQHLLSAVFVELFGIATVSFHMGSATSTIELQCAALTSEQLRSAEERANRIVHENRQVRIAFEDATSALGLRKPSERSGSLRIVTIEGLDRSACGGTHIRATGEIGAILLRSLEKIRGNVRLEFLCGLRAIRRARGDYEALEGAARAFSARVDEVPALVVAQADRLKESEKVRQRLASELAEYRGRALYAETPDAGQGIRLHSRILSENSLAEDIRSEANGFVRQGRAVYVVVAGRAALIAASSDSGIHAGNVLRAALAKFDGKGGGSAQLAQGSFNGSAEEVVAYLRGLLLFPE